jgi:hypothetical protein
MHDIQNGITIGDALMTHILKLLLEVTYEMTTYNKL